VRPDGKPVADTAEQLVQGNLWYPIDVDEHGAHVGGAPVATGTDPPDGGINSSCDDFTSSAFDTYGLEGSSAAGFSGWESYYENRCADPFRLYCLEATRSVAVTVPDPGPSRIAFVSRDHFGPNDGGVASADRQCQDDAVDAGLSGTFKALLAVADAGALSRFDLGGLPWRRVDKVKIVESAGDMANFDFVAPFVTSTGEPLYQYVWLGALRPTSASGGNCSEWTDPTYIGPSSVAKVHTAGFIAMPSAIQSLQCDSPIGNLYCLGE
jgi:hypothetical protein